MAARKSTAVAKLAQPPLPWELQTDESITAFHAFAIYRDMGPERSLVKVAAAVKKAERHIASWSAKHQWVERVRAWERELDEKRRRQLETEQSRMRTRHKGMLAAATRDIIDRMEGNPSRNVVKWSPNSLDGADLIRALEVVIRNDRLAHGEATDIVKGAFLYRADELRKVAGDLIDIALRYIPEEAQALFRSDVEQYARGG